MIVFLETGRRALPPACWVYNTPTLAAQQYFVFLETQVDEQFRLEQAGLERKIMELIRSRLRKRQATLDKNNKAGRGGGNGADGSSSNAYRQKGGAFPVASEATIDSLLRKQTRAGAPLSPGDWQGVVRHLYRDETGEAQTVGFLIREATFSRKGQGGRDGTGAVGGGRERSKKVPFGVFLQVLLGYQLHRHLRCLRLFKEDYRKV